MLTKLVNVLGALALATLLAGGGFAGYLFGSGRLDAARVDRIAGILRGEEDAAAPTTAPAGTDLAAEPTEGGGAAVCTEDELRAMRQRKHLEMLEAERAARDLEAQRRLLEQVLQHVVEEQERLAAEKEALARQRERSDDSSVDLGFQKEVELVAGLAPKQAKEHIVRVWQKQPADAVRLFLQLSPTSARKILEQFKTPEELQMRTDLLEQIRVQGKELSARVSGTTGGAAAQ